MMVGFGDRGGGPADQVVPEPGTERPDREGDRPVLYFSASGAFCLDQHQCDAARVDVERVTDSARARGLLESAGFDCGLYAFPDREMETIRAEIEALLSADPQVVWIALLPRARLSTDEAAGLVSRYFFDYHTTPPDPHRLCIAVGHACGMTRLARRLETSALSEEQDAKIIGDSPAIRSLLLDIRKVASVDAAVLITGESGTGKELAAQAIHRRSSRSKGPFIPVNCGALPASLIQAELFGHEKGAFTGAHCRQIGRFEAADGGTLFLDEIEDLPLELQVNLLRFLEEGTVDRLGNSRAISVNVRVIAASHQHLEQAVAERRFRDDLYFRLNVLHIAMPRLAERDGDVELLARAFLQRFAVNRGTRARGFSHAAVAAMHRYPWPGNVRELLNRVQRAAVMTDGKRITPKDLGLADAVPAPSTIAQARLDAEKRAIETALTRTGHNATQAARDLGISRATLYRLVEKYGISS